MMIGLLKPLMIAFAVVAYVLFIAAYITAADCPIGETAVRNLINWPICVKKGD